MKRFAEAHCPNSSKAVYPNLDNVLRVVIEGDVACVYFSQSDYIKVKVEPSLLEEL